RRDIGLESVAPIDCDRATAAEGSDVVTTRYERANRVRCGIDSWRIHHRRTVWTVIASAGYHHNAGSSLGFHSSLQCIRRTAFGRRADPGVTRNIRSPKRVSLAAADRVRRKEPFHALDVSGRCSIALVHVTATNPPCARRHPDLVAHAVIADCCPYGMRPM